VTVNFNQQGAGGYGASRIRGGDGVKKSIVSFNKLKADTEKGKPDIVEYARKQTELNDRIKEHKEKINRLGMEKHYELKAYIDEIQKMEKISTFFGTHKFSRKQAIRIIKGNAESD
jgi:hypothetical protein